MAQTSTHTTGTNIVIVRATLVIWSITLIALGWLPDHVVPQTQQLPMPFELLYRPWFGFPVLAVTTLLLGWFARNDEQGLWRMTGASVLLTIMYLFMLT